MTDNVPPDHIKKLKTLNDHWLQTVLSITPTNHAIVEDAIDRIYDYADCAPLDEVVWFGSPKAMFDAFDDRKVNTKIEQELHVQKERVSKMLVDIVKTHGTGQLITSPSEIYQIMEYVIRASTGSRIMMRYYMRWLDLITLFNYEMCNTIFGCNLHLSLMDALRDMATQTIWWIPLENKCLVADRHTALHVDAEGEPHCEDEAAIGFPDGWGVYAWHGTHVPEHVILRSQDITSETIMSEWNAEVARVMLERYGQDNFIRDGGFTIQQSDDYGDLYRVEFDSGDEPIVAVHVQDASTDRDYFLYVPPHIRTAHEGVAWSFGYDNPSDYAPDRET